MDQGRQVVPDLMTQQELVDRLGLSKDKVHQMQMANELPFPPIRIGGRVMFSRRAYETWLSVYDYTGEEEKNHAGQENTVRV